MEMKVRICFMDDARKFIIQGTGWETIIEIDVSKYSHLPPTCANTQIREEAARKGLEWFKNNPDDSLELSINLGIWEKKPDCDNANQWHSMQAHLCCFLLEHSAYMKNKKDNLLIITSSPESFFLKLHINVQIMSEN